MHDAPAGMQEFAQRVWPLGHAPPQVDPSHVAVPPAGAEHAEHEVPQDAGEALSTQASSHAWKPMAHVKLQR
jgi:hypothetical protein